MSAAHSNNHIEVLKLNLRKFLGHRLSGRELEMLDTYLDIAYVRGQQNGLEEAREVLGVRPIRPITS